MEGENILAAVFLLFLKMFCILISVNNFYFIVLLYIVYYFISMTMDNCGFLYKEQCFYAVDSGQNRAVCNK